MTTKAKYLDVFISGKHCGQVEQNEFGALSFKYDALYSGTPLSLSMPIKTESFDDNIIRPYLLGLLPDNDFVRNDAAQDFGCSADNPFALLSFMGKDCPGAVQLIKMGTSLSKEEHLKKLSEAEVAEILGKIESQDSRWSSSFTNSGHWSLGGAQAKVALRLENNTWYKCEGGAATSHILKPGVLGFPYQALDEFICMRTASHIGLPVAKVSYKTFNGHDAIVIERYDRYYDSDGVLHRLHQEDFCQALSVYPTKKYAEQGGPSTPQILELLSATSEAANNISMFITYLFFNYFIGATDAHAKNYSLIFNGSHVWLAPLYDVASIAAYENIAPKQRKPLRAAMSIGGENRFGMLNKSNITKLAQQTKDYCDIGYEEIAAIALKLASEIPDALFDVISDCELDCLKGINIIKEPLLNGVKGNCNRFLRAFR